MAASPLKSRLEELLKAHRLQAEAPPLRGERRLSPLPTGIADMDALLGGGLPRGQVSEACGPASSGRTGLALATLGRTMRLGALAAWVDPGDHFDPASAAEGGVDLGRLLWLRGSLRISPVAPAALRLRDPLPRAIAATATLLGSGLFELVVLDLAGLPAAELRRLPHTTWLRLQRTVEPTPSALLLLADAHVAHGPGGVSLALSPAQGCWVGSGPGRLLTGLSTEARWSRRVQGSRLTLHAFGG